MSDRVGRWILSAVVGVGLLVGVGCGDPPDGDDDVADDDTTVEPETCQEGYRLDPELPDEFLDEFPDKCVPQACGVGRWGGLEVDDDTIFADAGAAAGGDGTEATPFAGLQAAIDAAGQAGGQLVAVAAGTYAENLQLGVAHDGVYVAGRCADLVVLDASGGGADDPGIHVGSQMASGKEWQVSGLTVTGAAHAGIWLDGGRLSLADTAVVANREYGILAWGATSDLMLSAVSVTDTQPLSDGTLGQGIHVQSGASLTAESCLIARNTDIGIIVGIQGASAVLHDVEVRETVHRADGASGRGIEAQSGASLVASGCLVEANTDIGIMVGHEGTTAQLTDVTVRQTKMRPDGTNGRGIEVRLGAFLSAEDVVVEDNADIGIMVGDDGSEGHLLGVDVLSTRVEADGTGGRGISVQGPSSLTAEDCRVEGNAETGIFVSSGSAHLTNVVVSETLGQQDGTMGRGIEIQDSATLQAESCTIAGNADVGILVTSGSSAQLTDVDVTDTRLEGGGTGGRGASIQQASSLSAEDCRFDRNGNIGILVTSGSTAHLSNVDVSNTQAEADGASGWGIGVQGGSLLQADGCVLDANSEVGIMATDEGTQALLADVQIRGTKRAAETTVAGGVVCQRGAMLTANDIVVEQTEGLGLAALDQGELHCTGCDLTDSSFAGVLTWGEGLVDLTDVVCVGTSADANEGGGVGIYASARFGPSTLQVDGSSFEDHPYAAVWLDGEGSYSIRDSTLVGGYGMELEYPDGTTLIQHGDGIVATNGIAAWDGATGLELVGNEIRDAVRAGILLDGSSALLTGNAFSSNATDLVWQDCTGVSEPGGLQDVPSVDYCPTYQHHTAPLEFNLYLEEQEPLEMGRAYRTLQ